MSRWLAKSSYLSLLLADLFRVMMICLSSLAGALCPLKCVCNENALSAWCDGAGLGIVPITLNPQLEELFLTNNRIQNILGAFGVYGNLKYLDMSNNRVASLGERNFVMQKHLQVLHLSRNVITSLNNGSFSGLKMVRIVNLRENFLKEIVGGVLRPLHKLEEADLTKNKIERLDDDAFLGLDHLKILLLRDNLLTHIPLKSFHHIPELKILDLGLNSLKVLSAHSFPHLNALEELQLDGCEIETIRRGSFKNLIKLEKLHLQNNELKDIPSLALHALSNLVHLRVGGNKMRFIPVLSLGGLYSLKSLSVDDAPHLSTIKRGAFADNSQLERLSLSYNKALTRFESGVFQGLSNLKEVSVRGNGLSTIPRHLLEWDRLDWFDARDNPLDCNCSLLWLRDYLRVGNWTEREDSSVLDYKKVVCREPSFLRDVYLTDASEDELGCHRLFYIQIWAVSCLGAGLFAVSFVVLVMWYRAKMISGLKAKYHADEKVHHHHQGTCAISPEYPEEKVVPLVLSRHSNARTGTRL